MDHFSTGGGEVTKKQKSVKGAQSANAKPKKKRGGIPSFTVVENDQELLNNLNFRDFPTTIEGKMAFCDYKVLYYTSRKAELKANHDPDARLKKKIEKAKARLTELEKELTNA